MHRLTATDTPMVRYTRTIFPSYAIQLTNKKIMIDGRKQTIVNAISFYLDSIFNYLDGESDSILYPLPVIYDL